MSSSKNEGYAVDQNLRRFSKEKFATILYSEIEEIEAASPLGFPAPIVHRSKVIRALCINPKDGKISEENVLLYPNQNNEEPRIAYMLTPFKLKHTICGKIIKGVVLKRTEARSESSEQKEPSTSTSDCQKNDEYSWEITDDMVAIKIDYRQIMERLHSDNHKPTNPENPWKEVAAMQLLGNEHPNVIGLVGAFMDDKCLYEIMKYCSGGNLSALMKSHPTGISEARSRRIFKQILGGLCHIHSHGVCHHDISTDNVLLDGDETKCVIIDFGMCLRIPHSYPDDPAGTTDDTTDISMGTNRRLIHSHTYCGKLRFMAPEIYNKHDHFDGLAVDIWSLGVVLFVLLTGRQPYEKPDVNDSGFYDLIDDCYYWNTTKINPCFSWGFEISKEAVDLLRQMLRVDPRERATLGWVLSHKWVNDITTTEEDDPQNQPTVLQ